MRERDSAAARDAGREGTRDQGRAGRGRGARSPRFWFDPRFAIGVLLIVASVVGVTVIVGAADDGVEVYAARSALAPGDRVHSNDLVATTVRLDGAARLYLVPNDVPDAGIVVTRAVARGELVPESAVGSAEGVDDASVVLSVKGELATSVIAGSTVDVWAAAQSSAGLFDPPAVIVSSATVVRVIEPQGIVATTNTRSIELVVPRSRIARALEAVANDDAVSIVPTGLPAR